MWHEGFTCSIPLRLCSLCFSRHMYNKYIFSWLFFPASLWWNSAQIIPSSSDSGDLSCASSRCTRYPLASGRYTQGEILLLCSPHLTLPLRGRRAAAVSRSGKQSPCGQSEPGFQPPTLDNPLNQLGRGRPSYCHLKPSASVSDELKVWMRQEKGTVHRLAMPNRILCVWISSISKWRNLSKWRNVSTFDENALVERKDEHAKGF